MIAIFGLNECICRQAYRTKHPGQKNEDMISYWPRNHFSKIDSSAMAGEISEYQKNAHSALQCVHSLYFKTEQLIGECFSW